MSLHTGNEDQDQDGILCMPNAFQPINRPASGYVYVTSDPPTFSTIDYGDYIFDKDVDEIESVYDDDDVDSESSDDFDSGSSDEQQQEEQGESSRAAVMRPGPDNQDGLPKKRARVACRECRRLRTRCVQPNPGKPPCLACTRAGIPTEECEFLKPGEVDTDRDYRHPQGRGYHASRREPGNIRRNVLAAPVPPRIIITGGSPWDLLPPMKEVREAVECFVKHYFQLGFIPKEQFLESLQEKFTPACSPFFLLCLLSISARLTPSLIKRHGTGVQASEVYTKHASSMAMMEVYQDATLDRCQGFFFLSIAEQGSEKQNSSINLAIAMRMATILQLHREESYVIPTPTSKLVLKAESARRTFWMLYSQDCLHFGRRSPKLMHEADISTLLPSDEFDFETAREPESRAALPNTQPALERPELITDKGRSLFATRIQSHYHWGVISRRAISSDMGAPPWEATSEYEQIRKELDEWESGLPDNHLWSEVLLSEYRGAEVDSAYLGVTMLPRLCNIVLRKAYLHEMLKLHPHDPPKRMFWENMATEFFQNVDELWHQVNAQYGEKIEDQGPGAPMAAFCVYTCGFMACYAAKYPRLCPSSSSLPQDGWHIVDRVLTILGESQTIWPFASRWYEHLRKFAWTPALGVPVSLVALSVPVVESGIADDSREPMPRFFDFRLLDSPRLEAMQPQRMYPRNDDNDEWESPDDMVLPPFQQYIEVNPTLPSLNPDREIMPAVPPPPQPPSHPVFVAPAPSLQAQQQVLPPPHSSHLDPMLEIAVPERPDDDSQQYRYELRYIEEWREPDPEEYDQQYPMYVEEQHHYHSVYLAEYPRQWAMEPPLRSRPLPFEPLHPHHIMHSERYPPQQPLHLGPPQQPAHAVSSDERLHQHPLYLDPEQRQPSYGVHSDEHVDLDDLYLDPEEQPAHDVHSDERLHRHPAYPDLQQQPSYPVQSDQHHQHHVVHPPQHLAHANPQQAAYAGQHHPHQAMPPAPMYDPTPIPPEEDHFADALELNDGYEHELRNFVSDGVTESAQPNGPSISRLFR